MHTLLSVRFRATLSKTATVVLIAAIVALAYAANPFVSIAISAPVAVVDTYAATEDTALNVAPNGVLGNDADDDVGDVLSATLVSGTTNGSLTLNLDGSFDYVPGQDFNGTDSFTYIANDGSFNSLFAIVTINVSGANDVSTTQNQTLSVAMNIASSSALSAGDIDGDTLTYATSSDALHGTIALDASGQFTYTPELNYIGVDSFTWHAFDGTASSSDATVSITVSPVVEDTLALCSNGSDNDADTQADLLDTDCVHFVPQIGISLTIVNDNSGSATTSDVSIRFDASTTTGATTTASVGAHQVTGTDLANYTRTIGGDCALDGMVSLAIGSTSHCTVTYNDNASGGGTPAAAIVQSAPSNGPIGPIVFGYGPGFVYGGTVLGASTTTTTASLPELPPGCTPVIGGFMRKSKMANDTEQVKKLQQFLNDKIQAGLPLTGEFGASTDAAVKKFQTAYAQHILSPWGISAPTGFVYLTTQRWINLMSCATLTIPMPVLVPYSGN